MDGPVDQAKTRLMGDLRGGKGRVTNAPVDMMIMILEGIFGETIIDIMINTGSNECFLVVHCYTRPSVEMMLRLINTKSQ